MVASLRLALALVLLSAVARADTAVPEGFDPRRCTMMDGPLRRAWSSGLDEKARRAAGPGFSLRDVGKRHLLLDNGARDRSARARVIDAATLAPVGAPVAGIPQTALLEGEDGGLLGLLSVEEVAFDRSAVRVRAHAPDGTVRWSSAPISVGLGDSLAALVVGDTVVIAIFHRIATGSSLLALELATGRPRWRADVGQLNVPHSKYWNDVTLTRSGDRVVLRGFEAGGCYEQIFDIATGRRVSFRR